MPWSVVSIGGDGEVCDAVTWGGTGESISSEASRYDLIGLKKRIIRALLDVSKSTNLRNKGLSLSGSWQQGHSAAYNTPLLIPVVCRGFIGPGA